MVIVMATLVQVGSKFGLNVTPIPVVRLRIHVDADRHETAEGGASARGGPSSNVWLDIDVESGESDLLFSPIDRIHLVLVRFPRAVFRLRRWELTNGEVHSHHIRK